MQQSMGELLQFTSLLLKEWRNALQMLTKQPTTLSDVKKQQLNKNLSK